MASKDNTKYRQERTGQIRINHQGLKMKVIDYQTSHNLRVQFEDGTIVKCEWKEFNKGALNNPNCKDKGWGVMRDDRLNEENYNNQGCKMKIVKYNNANEIIVEFDNNPNQQIKTCYTHFKKGNVSNPFIPSVYNVGITGIEAPCMNGNIKLKEYTTWIRMIERCYKEIKKPGDESYEDCWVCDEFLYYPNFYNWITQQDNYEVWKTTYNFALDKDILFKGNKIYAPDKCCLVPNKINNLIKNSKSRRGKYLIGVTKDNKGDFISQCWNGLINKNIHLGRFDTEYDAYLAYKKYKEKLIKETAEIEYNNGIITKACRDALFNYEVEPTD